MHRLRELVYRRISFQLILTVLTEDAQITGESRRITGDVDYTGRGDREDCLKD